MLIEYKKDCYSEYSTQPELADGDESYEGCFEMSDNKKHVNMLKNKNSFKLVRGVLYREVTEREVKKTQLVLPVKSKSL